MRKRKQRDLPLDEIIRQFVRCAKRIERDGGYLRLQIEFGPKQLPKGKEKTQP